jgi:hypothetical protein
VPLVVREGDTDEGRARERRRTGRFALRTPKVSAAEAASAYVAAVEPSAESATDAEVDLALAAVEARVQAEPEPFAAGPAAILEPERPTTPPEPVEAVSAPIAPLAAPSIETDEASAAPSIGERFSSRLGRIRHDDDSDEGAQPPLPDLEGFLGAYDLDGAQEPTEPPEE